MKPNEWGTLPQRGNDNSGDSSRSPAGMTTRKAAATATTTARATTTTGPPPSAKDDNQKATITATATTTAKATATASAKCLFENSGDEEEFAGGFAGFEVAVGVRGVG